MKRIKHNDLSWYFMRPHSELPQAYLASCEKFFNTFHSVDNEKFKRQAASRKRQASSNKLDNVGFYGKKIIESEK